MNQLFQIGMDTWKSLSLPEVESTVKAMKELGIYRLPYPKVDLRIAADAVVHSDYKGSDPRIEEMIQSGVLYHGPGGKLHLRFGEGAWLEVKNLSLETVDYSKSLRICQGNKHFRPNNGTSPEWIINESERDTMCEALIVLLATRNSVKTLVHKKSIGLGIGKKDGVYEYTTTITLPKDLEADAEHKPTGATRAPYMRRGHIRRQHFGPGMEFVKRIWIEPVFVNADPAWVSKRVAYNVSL